jgi:hypothetical protein
MEVPAIDNGTISPESPDFARHMAEVIPPSKRETAPQSQNTTAPKINQASWDSFSGGAPSISLDRTSDAASFIPRAANASLAPVSAVAAAAPFPVSAVSQAAMPVRSAVGGAATAPTSETPSFWSGNTEDFTKMLDSGADVSGLNTVNVTGPSNPKEASSPLEAYQQMKVRESAIQAQQDALSQETTISGLRDAREKLREATNKLKDQQSQLPTGSDQRNLEATVNRIRSVNPGLEQLAASGARLTRHEIGLLGQLRGADATLSKITETQQAIADAGRQSGALDAEIQAQSSIQMPSPDEAAAATTSYFAKQNAEEQDQKARQAEVDRRGTERESGLQDRDVSRQDRAKMSNLRDQNTSYGNSLRAWNAFDKSDEAKAIKQSVYEKAQADGLGEIENDPEEGMTFSAKSSGWFKNDSEKNQAEVDKRVNDALIEAKKKTFGPDFDPEKIRKRAEENENSIRAMAGSGSNVQTSSASASVTAQKSEADPNEAVFMAKAKAKNYTDEEAKSLFEKWKQANGTR